MQSKISQTDNPISFIDNPTIQHQSKYIEIIVDCARIVQSYRDSVFSYEWLDSEGHIKAAGDQPEKERLKRETIDTALQNGSGIEKAILGIGMRDNIEFGSGRPAFLTLYAQGLTELPVHILKSNEKDFKAFRVDIS